MFKLMSIQKNSVGVSLGIPIPPVVLDRSVREEFDKILNFVQLLNLKILILLHFLNHILFLRYH